MTEDVRNIVFNFQCTTLTILPPLTGVYYVTQAPVDSSDSSDSTKKRFLLLIPKLFYKVL